MESTAKEIIPISNRDKTMNNYAANTAIRASAIAMRSAVALESESETPSLDHVKAVHRQLIHAIIQESSNLIEYIEQYSNDTEQTTNNTAWRDDPATDKQKNALDKHEIQYKPSITKGEASDLLDTYFASKK